MSVNDRHSHHRNRHHHEVLALVAAQLLQLMQTHSTSAPSCHDLADKMQGRWLVTSRGALQKLRHMSCIETRT